MKGYPTYTSSADYLKQLAELLEALPEPSDRLVDALYAGFEQGRTVFLVGNGGSAANASHFGQDLAKGTLSSMSATRRFRVVPLTDNIGFITALANDEGYESIFEQQLRNLAAADDLLVAISGSGNSPNILRAAEYARSIGMTIIGVTGFDGGKLKILADVSVHIPVNDMGMAEALHGVVFHLVMCRLRERLAQAG
jgi:D-sedoheptulose 7-phosphate isomerase